MQLQKIKGSSLGTDTESSPRCTVNEKSKVHNVCGMLSFLHKKEKKNTDIEF